MLYYLLFWTLLGFIIHFYIIFGTNLLTQSPVPVSVFPLFQCSVEKEYQTEPKRNETFGKVIFGKKAIQETWSACQEIREVLTRVGGAPLPRGAPVAPPTYPLHPYILTYPKTSRIEPRSGVPPPQASVATKNQSGPCTSTLPEGESLTGGHLHYSGALHEEEGVVHPWG